MVANVEGTRLCTLEELGGCYLFSRYFYSTTEADVCLHVHVRFYLKTVVLWGWSSRRSVWLVGGSVRGFLESSLMVVAITSCVVHACFYICML